jgi:hypothetical protein
MKILMFAFTLALTSNYANAKYTCAANVEIIDLNGKSISLRLTNSPLFDDFSSSVISKIDGSVIDPANAYTVNGIDFRMYNIGMSFNLLQRVEDENTFKFFLHVPGIVDPDPIYGKIFLLDHVEQNAVQGTIIVPNGSSIKLVTSKSKANGELFYIVDCTK